MRSKRSKYNKVNQLPFVHPCASISKLGRATDVTQRSREPSNRAMLSQPTILRPSCTRIICVLLKSLTFWQRQLLCMRLSMCVFLMLGESLTNFVLLCIRGLQSKQAELARKWRCPVVNPEFNVAISRRGSPFQTIHHSKNPYRRQSRRAHVAFKAKRSLSSVYSSRAKDQHAVGTAICVPVPIFKLFLHL